MPDFDKLFSTSSDVSVYSIGYGLNQADEAGCDHAIQFEGRSLHVTEQNYCATEIEGLALVAVIKAFRPHIADQKAVKYTMLISSFTRIWL